MRKCVICQQNKALTRNPARLLQPLPVLSKVWDQILMDFIEVLPALKGSDSVLVVVDWVTKYAYFFS